MPLRRCRSCRHWKMIDPSDSFGSCQFNPTNAPFWWRGDIMVANRTHGDAGTDCTGFEHGYPEHPLDSAPERLFELEPGDVVPMRTYTLGNISRSEAVVRKVTSRYAMVSFMHKDMRIRLTRRRLDHDHWHRAGTIVGMEDWGIDMDRPVRSMSGVRQFDPAVIETALAKIKVGDPIQLRGMPPFEARRIKGKVTVVRGSHLRVMIPAEGTATLYRTGEMAGTVEGHMWELDCD